MAKTTALARRFVAPAPRVIVMSPPKRGRVRRAAARVGHIARRGAHHGGRAIKRGLPITGLALGGAALGWAEGSRALDKLPIPALLGSKAATVGVAGFLATRFFRNPTIRMLGTASVIVAAFDIAKQKAGGVSGFEDGGAGRGGGL